MDVALDPKILQARQWQAWGRGLLVLLAAIIALLLLRQWLAPSVNRADLRTALVERGGVSTEVLASGTVVPVNERVLISPVGSSIAEVYLPLGSHVEAGDAILKVDSAQMEREVARVRDELRLKDLEIEGLRQQQQRALRELRDKQALSEIDLRNQKVILDRYETLARTNVVSQFDHDAAALNVSKTELQIAQLERQIADTLAADDNALQQREVERQLLAQQLAEQERLLRETTLRAPTDGILTVLQSELGQNVAAGAELARISDLSSYRVDATLSDFFLHQIGAGMPVNVNLGTGAALGRLERILPAVDNGTIRVQIELEDPGNTQLKPNLRVEAGIVTEQRTAGLRVTNGLAFNGPGRQRIFVLQGGEALRREVDVGLVNGKYVEIREGVEEGDEIVISDMSAYLHLESINVIE